MGSTHAWLLGVDIDDPTDPALATLRTLLDRAGAEWLEGDSGRARHMFVYDPDGSLRSTLPGELKQLHPDHTIDFRLQRTGSAMRPFGAPHRCGGRSIPDDLKEALAQLEHWLANHGDGAEGENAASFLSPLRAWAVALRAGDYRRSEELGHGLRRIGGRVDRSAVDLSLAYAYRNAGRTPTQYLDDLLPGGDWQSPKACDPETADPEGYLRRQWDTAAASPVAIDRFRAGFEYLDEWAVAVEASDLSAEAKSFIDGLLMICRQVGKTWVSASRRQIEELTGLAPATIQKLWQSGALALWVRRHRPDDPKLKSYEYQLLVSEELVNLNHASLSPPVSYLCGSEVPSSRNHPAFGPPGRGGLGRKAPEVLRGFSLTEAHSVAAAMKLRGDVGETAFRRLVSRFLEVGILVGNRADGSRINDGFDWTRFALGTVVCEAKDEQARRHARERAARAASLSMPPSPKAKAASDHYDPERQAEWTSEIQARTEEHFEEIVQRLTPAAVRFGLVDVETGEVISDQEPLLDPAVLEPSPLSKPRLLSVADQLDSMNCACCGVRADDIEPRTELPWHLWCRMRAPFVDLYERRYGLSIPIDLRSTTTHTPVSLDDEWATCRKELVAA